MKGNRWANMIGDANQCVAGLETMSWSQFHDKVLLALAYCFQLRMFREIDPFGQFVFLCNCLVPKVKTNAVGRRQ